MKPTKVSQARVAALRTLMLVGKEPTAEAGDALDNYMAKLQMSDRDLRLATAIVMNVLRFRLLLDAQFRPFLTKPPSKLPAGAAILLRMAVAQKLMLDRVPDHAIVNEQVELARQELRLQSREIAFLNAVLRRIAGLERLKLPSGNSTKDLSIRYSHPEWLVEMLREKFPADFTQIMDTDNNPPRLALRVNTASTTVEMLSKQLQAEGITTSPAGTVPEALLVSEEISAPALVRTSAFAEGLFYFQDEASQLISFLVAPRPDEKILDLCSAPGGKATHLAQMQQKAHITATDFSEDRLKLVHENVGRLGLSNITIEPIAAVLSGNEVNDAVLVDAPCSGLGTLRKNPDIRYRCSAASLQSLAAKQLEILQKAASLVAPRGRLVYSTCTISDVENAGVIKSFLSQNPAFQLAAPAAESIARKFLCPDGLLRTWPENLQMDGFEAAILIRNK